MRLGIVGMGVVGRAIYDYYHGEYCIDQYDKMTDSVQSKGLPDADVVFICVGTPYAGNGRGLDCSQVYAAVDALEGEKLVIVKSTVMPGTTADLQSKYPQHRIAFVPEFLTERDATRDFANPSRSHIIGTDSLSAEDLETIYGLLPKPKTCYMLSSFQAELVKMSTNAYLALKVSFANQMYDLGMSNEALIVLGEDSRIGGSHLRVQHEGFRGFGGRCLPKDLCALFDYKESANLLQDAYLYNKRLLDMQGLDIKYWCEEAP